MWKRINEYCAEIYVKLFRKNVRYTVNFYTYDELKITNKNLETFVTLETYKLPQNGRRVFNTDCYDLLSVNIHRDLVSENSFYNIMLYEIMRSYKVRELSYIEQAEIRLNFHKSYKENIKTIQYILSHKLVCKNPNNLVKFVIRLNKYNNRINKYKIYKNHTFDVKLNVSE